MATITVETGAGLVNSNSYVSLSDQKAFVGSIAQPTATDAELTRAIILAARFLDGNYRQKWRGYKANSDNAMEWPRVSVFYGGGFYSQEIPFTVIPQRLKDAQCELTLRALTGELSADVSTGIKREKVDVLETEYFSGSTPKQSYPVVENLINDYLKPAGNGDLIRG